MYCVIVQNKSKINFFFQFNADFCCGLKRNYLYVSLKVAEEHELNFPIDNYQGTQDITQLNNWAL